MCTTAYILSGCPAALEDRRYIWRHDSVLQNLWHSLQSQLTRSMLTSQASHGLKATIPLKVAVTTLLSHQGWSLHMLEQTVCGNTCNALDAAHTRKSHKQEYLQLLSDGSQLEELLGSQINHHRNWCTQPLQPSCPQ